MEVCQRLQAGLYPWGQPVPVGVLWGHQEPGKEKELGEDEEAAQLVGCRAQDWAWAVGGGVILDPL